MTSELVCLLVSELFFPDLLLLLKIDLSFRIINYLLEIEIKNLFKRNPFFPKVILRDSALITHYD